jgi:hypothetical protein
MRREQFDYLAEKQEANNGKNYGEGEGKAKAKEKGYIPEVLEWNPGPFPPNIYNEGFFANLR